MRARPTVYSGVEMRSRLEATYAQTLDEMGLPWRYEPKAYGARGHRQYLPDFDVLLPDHRVVHVEVRPTFEGAYRGMEQMAVIWESEPDARLMVTTPEMTWMADGEDRTWTMERMPWGYR